MTRRTMFQKGEVHNKPSGFWRMIRSVTTSAPGSESILCPSAWSLFYFPVTVDIHRHVSSSERHSGQTLTCPRQGPPLTRCPPGTIRSHPGARRGSDCTGARPAGAGRRKRGACTVTSAAPTDGRKPENHCLRAEGLLTSQSFHFTDKKTDSGRRSRPAVCGLWQSRRQSCGVPCSGLSAPLLASQL